MKLRNKKTGEIGELTFDTRAKPYRKDYAVFVKIDDIDVGDRTYFYDSFAELCENWEDYVEPKNIYFIANNGQIHAENGHDRFREERKEIGNYFETEEEAEQAVEKMKAWKRLRDNGYRFRGIGVEYDGYKIHLECDIMKKEHYTPTQDHKDLDLLFGGEE